jgi:hypothetical protein
MLTNDNINPPYEPPNRWTSIWFLDPEKNVIAQAFELNQAGNPWMDDNPHSLGFENHYIRGTVNMRVNAPVDNPIPIGVVRKIDGVWGVQQSNSVMQITGYEVNEPFPPDDLWIRHIPTKGSVEKNREWAYAHLKRDESGSDWHEIHLCRREYPETDWTSEALFERFEISTDAGYQNEHWVFATANSIPVVTDRFCYNYTFDPGQLENPLAGTSTYQRVYEYNIEAKTNTKVYEWVFPDNDPALIALGKVEYLHRFLQDPDDKWCGFTTTVFATTAPNITADVHFYLAPIDDILDEFGNIATLGGMANVVKKFTFNMPAEIPGLTDPPADNEAFRCSRFWHIGGGRFGFTIEETKANAISAEYPLVFGIFDWDDDAFTLQGQTAKGWALGGDIQTAVHRQWVCGKLDYLPTSAADFINLDIEAKVQTRWVDATMNDIAESDPKKAFLDFNINWDCDFASEP